MVYEEIVDLLREQGKKAIGEHFLRCQFATAESKIVCYIDINTTDDELRRFFDMLSDMLPETMKDLYRRYGERGKVTSFEIKWVWVD
ncbi:MAG: hypothetical protein DRJ18_00395 [Candidatus Methanomethylicota archaeon]|nr:MAG: hypothetical protein DRJ18_00395 [Candidatus Verstraetearchaeota archaeon]